MTLNRPLTDIEVKQALAYLDLARAVLDPPTPPDPPAPTPTLRVVQWNTHHGGIPVNAAGVDQKLNVQAITDWLIKFTPDIVSLNELEENDGYGTLDQLEHHRAALQVAQGVPWYAAFVAVSGSDRRQGGGQGLLTKTPQDTTARKGLPATRSILYVQADPTTALFTTHLSNTSPTDRAAQVAQALVWQRAFPMDRAILCGDFNAVPGASELNPLKDVYQDAWVLATQKGTATSFLPNGITHGVHRIDYVCVKGFDVIAVDVPDTSVGGVFPSDHHPVVAVLRPLL